ncbi:HAD-IIIA family hydrolase [Ignatzschineria cameli]|nr:HAD-IIIA family hydrolase [Ignatzschineria cameli]
MSNKPIKPMVEQDFEKGRRLPFPDLVILDRDGVINQDSSAYIKSRDEWIPIPGSLEAMARLHQAGVKIGIATNQRGIALGLYDHQALEEMHQKMTALLSDVGGAIDEIAFCTADDPLHPDRKPNPGMLLTIIKALDLPQTSVIYFVGDKSSDVAAAENATLQSDYRVIPVLVRTGNGIKSEKKLNDRERLTYNDLASFVDALLFDSSDLSALSTEE